MVFKPKHVATIDNEILLSGGMLDPWFNASVPCILNKVGCLM